MAVIQPGDIIAVDFDGTLCENAWPGIGSPNEDLITFLIKSREKGAQLILWTMREGELLEKALVWCRARGLGFDAVNDNVQKMKDFYGNNPRKVFANYYLDDHNLHVCWPEGYNCVMVGQEALALSYGRDWHEAKRQRLMEEVYKNIVAWYTPHVQALKTCEALTALKFTVLRGMREKINTGLMTEKIAGVQIMIEQIKAIYHIDEADLSRIRRRKLEEVQRKMVLDVNGKVMEGERE